MDTVRKTGIEIQEKGRALSALASFSDSVKENNIRVRMARLEFVMAVCLASAERALKHA